MQNLTIKLTLNDYVLCAQYVGERLRRRVPYYSVVYGSLLAIGMLVAFGFFAMFAVASRLKGSNGSYALLGTSCVAVAVGLYFLTTYLAQRMVGRQVLKEVSEKLYAPIECSFDAAGIVFATEHERIALQWHAIERFEVNGPHLYLLNRPNDGQIIPESAFASRVEFETCVAELHALWRQHR